MGSIWRIEHETKRRICRTLIDRYLVEGERSSYFAICNLSSKSVSGCLGLYVQAYTLHYTRQFGHFGISSILAADGPALYIIEPSVFYVSEC